MFLKGSYLRVTMGSSEKLTNFMHSYLANRCHKVSSQHLNATDKWDALVVLLKQVIND